MSRTVRVLRKIIVALIGFPLLALGIILIPLPGPGLLTCLAALLILSLEFDWVAPYLDKGKAQLRKITAEAKAKKEAIDKKYK